MNSTTHDLVRRINAGIEERVSRLTTSLIAATSADHDKLAGRILGMGEARTLVSDIVKQWGLADND